MSNKIHASLLLVLWLTSLSLCVVAAQEVSAAQEIVADSRVFEFSRENDSKEEVIANLSHFEGSRFIITTGEKSKTYDILLGDWLGTPLRTNQTIVTDSGTFLEFNFSGLQGVRVKLSENSMLSFVSQEDGNYIIKMHYGRIRIKTREPIEGEEPALWPVGQEGIWINGYDVSAFWQGGDMSYEIFYNTESFDPIYRTSVHAFTGQVELFHRNFESGSKVYSISPERKIISGGKMVKYQTKESWTEMNIQPQIEPEIITFWIDNPFSVPLPPVVPLVVAQQPEIEPEVSPEMVLVDPELENKKRKSRLTGNTLFTVGVGMLIGTTIARALIPVSDDSSNINEILLLSSFITGGALTLTGTGFLTYSSLLK